MELLNKIWYNKVMCYLFHKKKVKEAMAYVDPVTQRPYGKYKCEICGQKYIAKDKWSWYRIKTKKQLKKL